jgi:phosphoserine aminotransferase
VPDDYSVLFLQGGASTQFSMVPMCLMQPHKRAVYLDTGYFSLKAIKVASLFGRVHIAASSKGSDYDLYTL